MIVNRRVGAIHRAIEGYDGGVEGHSAGWKEPVTKNSLRPKWESERQRVGERKEQRSATPDGRSSIFTTYGELVFKEFLWPGRGADLLTEGPHW